MGLGDAQDASEVVAIHDKPVNCIEVLDGPGQHHVLITGSWDGNIKLWDSRRLGDRRAQQTLELPGPIIDMAVSQNNYLGILTADANRSFKIFDLRSSKALCIHDGSASPLHHQARCIAAFAKVS